MTNIPRSQKISPHTPQNCRATTLPHPASMPLSGKQEKTRLKVALSLAKHINWRTKQLKRKAYARIAEELNSFGVSEDYVAKMWRKHKQDILDTVNRDLVKSLPEAIIRQWPSP